MINKIKQVLVNIWPSIYRVINGTFYFLLNLLRTFITLAKNQIRNG
jgi:hypothetical protein